MRLHPHKAVQFLFFSTLKLDSHTSFPDEIVYFNHLKCKTGVMRLSYFAPTYCFTFIVTLKCLPPLTLEPMIFFQQLFGF